MEPQLLISSTLIDALFERRLFPTGDECRHAACVLEDAAIFVADGVAWLDLHLCTDDDEQTELRCSVPLSAQLSSGGSGSTLRISRAGGSGLQLQLEEGGAGDPSLQSMASPAVASMGDELSIPLPALGIDVPNLDWLDTRAGDHGALRVSSGGSSSLGNDRSFARVDLRLAGFDSQSADAIVAAINGALEDAYGNSADKMLLRSASASGDALDFVLENRGSHG